MLTIEQHLALAEIFKTIKTSKFPLTKLQLQLNKKYTNNILSQLSNHDLIEKTTRTVRLTTKGQETAYRSLRTLSVLKIFATEILGLSQKEADAYVQDIFFATNNYILEKYCTLIGHNNHYNILPGECCQRAFRETAERVLALSRLPLNTTAQILYLKTENLPNMQKLYELGLAPGAEIKILQHYPTYIVSINDQQIALEESAANIIFVKK